MGGGKDTSRWQRPSVVSGTCLQLQHVSLRKEDQAFEGSLGYSRQLKMDSLGYNKKPKAKAGIGSPYNLGAGQDKKVCSAGFQTGLAPHSYPRRTTGTQSPVSFNHISRCPRPIQQGGSMG